MKRNRRKYKNTEDTKWKLVNAEEYWEFVNGYSPHLERNVSMMCEPAMVSFNDFNRGKWPESMVARHPIDKSNHYILAELADDGRIAE